MATGEGAPRTNKDNQAGKLSQIYDAQPFNINGTEGFLHNTAESMARALNQETPIGRVFSFTKGDFFGASQQVAFIDLTGRVHGFSTRINTQEELDRNRNTIWTPIEDRGHDEADGIIKVDDQTGDVYELYETEEPDDAEKLDAQMNAWVGDVRKAHEEHPESGFIQYLPTEGDATIMDYTQGKRHRVTGLRHEQGNTVEYAASELPGIPMQDNTKVDRWIKMLS